MSTITRRALAIGASAAAIMAPATGTSSPLTPGTTFLRRAGTYDVYRVGAGTVEFSSAA